MTRKTSTIITLLLDSARYTPEMHDTGRPVGYDITQAHTSEFLCIVAMKCRNCEGEDKITATEYRNALVAIADAIGGRGHLWGYAMGVDESYTKGPFADYAWAFWRKLAVTLEAKGE